MKKILFLTLILMMAFAAASCEIITELMGPKECTEHVFDNTCDTDCNNEGCTFTREAEHVYDHDCDNECNTEGCGETRVTEHVFSNVCDKVCNTKGCKATRTVEHVFSFVCDEICDTPSCRSKREVMHVYTDDCDEDCNTEGCDETRTAPHAFEHKYDKVCDCGLEREIKRQAIILLGQSNMSGRGDLNAVDPISDDRIFMMRNDEWVKMEEPIHTDKTIAGIGLAASFAKGFVESFDCEVGLVPAAMGGSSLDDWAVGNMLYREAVRLIKIAMEDSEVAAILWHQGEANQSDRSYAIKLRAIFDAMLEDAGLDESKIVIVTGELFGTRSDAVHRGQLDELGLYYTNYGVAESDGLTVFDVTTHFDSQSLRVFGYRYFAIFYNRITGGTYQYNDDPKSYDKRG